MIRYKQEMNLIIIIYSLVDILNNNKYNILITYIEDNIIK